MHTNIRKKKENQKWNARPENRNGRNRQNNQVIVKKKNRPQQQEQMLFCHKFP